MVSDSFLDVEAGFAVEVSDTTMFNESYAAGPIITAFID